MSRIPQLIITLRGISGDTYMVEGLQPERRTTLYSGCRILRTLKNKLRDA
ncbi:hypothetical protein T4D_14785 [Trichinella pseudospiralis]|uniref:Uncharacterized protein n=1 Tax=Trichinella pseudospiralis TaxID=6337 RepID=A0A0V1DJS9_TRIPS|nr:hypothetical protein T4D_14785 [Trichinella pseudospiralis]